MSGRRNILRTLVETAAFPFVAVALFAFGVLASIAHLVAMPGLFLWDNSIERRLTRRLQKLAEKEVE
jgi:hypothetical protein